MTPRYRLVCGGREYRGRRTIWADLDAIDDPEPWILLQGGAPGADAHALLWAKARLRPYLTVEADWDLWGNRAGGIRNTAMADLGPVEVIAYPGGPGTRNMIDTARRRRIPIRLADVDNWARPLPDITPRPVQEGLPGLATPIGVVNPRTWGREQTTTPTTGEVL